MVLLYLFTKTGLGIPRIYIILTTFLVIYNYDSKREKDTVPLEVQIYCQKKIIVGSFKNKKTQKRISKIKVSKICLLSSFNTP